jgi:hypothetical protein
MSVLAPTAASMFGGDKGIILVPLCLGLPIGSLTGIVISERRQRRRFNRAALGISFAAVLGGVCIAVAAMDLIGSIAIILKPFIVSIASYAGFAIGCRSANQRAM